MTNESSNVDGSLLAVERQRIILDILEREGVVRNNELKDLLSVSAATIRSDLRELEKTGTCEIVWGGAVLRRPPTGDPIASSHIHERTRLFPDEKRRIGAFAAQLVDVGQTVIVDAGTTTVELVHHLSRELDYLRVVTPALNVAAAAAQFPHIEVVMTGGVLRHLTRSLIGPQTVRALEMFNADWVFLATGGFSLEHGVTTSNMLEIEVKRTMVQHAARVAVMADSSKFGQVRSLTVTAMSNVDVLITDKRLSDEGTKALETLGVVVYRV